MLEKFNQLAEQAATSVSRRQFLARFGRGAMVAAVTAGGLLALPGEAEAGRRCPKGYRFCRFRDKRCDRDGICVPKEERCPTQCGR